MTSARNRIRKYAGPTQIWMQTDLRMNSREKILLPPCIGCVACGFLFLFTPRFASAQNPVPDDADVEIPATTSPATTPSPDNPPSPVPAAAAPPPTTAAPQVDRPLDAPSIPLPPRPAPQEEPPQPSKLQELLPLGFQLSSYIQAQYEAHQDSEDQLRQGGAPYNQDRFLIRRARLRLDKDWQYASMLVELDGNTVKGATARIQKAEASLVWRAQNPTGLGVPLARFTLGLFNVPFGREIVESPKDRPFMERTMGSRALFPGEPDVGARLSGTLSFFEYAVALTNGQPLDDKSGFAATDPNGAKDIIARLGANVQPASLVKVSGGVSVLRGKGFHPGTDATKNTSTWQDRNENGAIDSGELMAVPGTAATPSQNFDRWAVGADLQVSLTSRWGLTRLQGEYALASNLDRGLFLADPIQTGIDVRQVAWHVSLTQDILKRGLVGFRYHVYDPNANAFDKRGGKLLPYSQTVKTYSPIVGLLVGEQARLFLQYDIIRDNMARDGRGVPTDLKNDQWTLRLQVQL